MNPHDRFTQTVDAYRRYRPSYPAALVEWVVAQAGLSAGATVVDIGCGTGISSRHFASAGLNVVGVDPNEAMLAAAREEKSTGTIEYRVGTAENLPLAPASADAAISGQAFHWFDLDHVIPEVRRVLRPGGLCAAFWNTRSIKGSPLLIEYEQLLRKHCADYPLASAANIRDRIASHPQVTNTRQADFPNAQQLDREGLFGRAWSSSYVVHGVRNAEAFNRELTAMFDRHAIADKITILYRTEVIVFEPSPTKR